MIRGRPTFPNGKTSFMMKIHADTDKLLLDNGEDTANYKQWRDDCDTVLMDATPDRQSRG